jgi:hypothetical protein
MLDPFVSRKETAQAAVEHAQSKLRDMPSLPSKAPKRQRSSWKAQKEQLDTELRLAIAHHESMRSAQAAEIERLGQDPILAELRCLCSTSSQCNRKQLIDSSAHDWAEAVARELLQGNISAHIKHLREGLSDVITPERLSQQYRSWEALQQTLAGSTGIDVDAWQAMSEAAPWKQVHWFWEILRELDTTHALQVFRWLTGWPTFPVNAERSRCGVRFSLLPSSRSDFLPVAHTCSNQIDIPPCESKAVLHERLSRAVFETTFSIS